MVFPFYICKVGVNHRPWMPINTQKKDCAASMRSAPLNCTTITKITCSSPGQTPFRKVFRADAFSFPYKYDIISEQMRCLATEGTWQWSSCMQIWCTGCIFPIHHLNDSPGANCFRISTWASRQTFILPQSILMTLCSSDASFRTKNSIVMSTSCQVDAINLAFYISLFTQAATGYKCWELPFSLVFHEHFSSEQ